MFAFIMLVAILVFGTAQAGKLPGHLDAIFICEATEIGEPCRAEVQEDSTQVLAVPVVRSSAPPARPGLPPPQSDRVVRDSVADAVRFSRGAQRAAGDEEMRRRMDAQEQARQAEMAARLAAEERTAATRHQLVASEKENEQLWNGAAALNVLLTEAEGDRNEALDLLQEADGEIGDLLSENGDLWEATEALHEEAETHRAVEKDLVRQIGDQAGRKR